MKHGKTWMTGILLAVLLLAMAGCGGADASKAAIDYGTSEIYTEADRQQAVQAILKEFKNMKGCRLESLTYSGDQCNSPENIAWMNELEQAKDAKAVFTQCIAFESSFRSPEKDAGAWEPNAEYHWSWYLSRSEGGDWKLMTWGYA